MAATYCLCPVVLATRQNLSKPINSIKIGKKSVIYGDVEKIYR